MCVRKLVGSGSGVIAAFSWSSPVWSASGRVLGVGRRVLVMREWRRGCAAWCARVYIGPLYYCCIEFVFRRKFAVRAAVVFVHQQKQCLFFLLPPCFFFGACQGEKSRKRWVDESQLGQEWHQHRSVEN